MSTGTSFNHGGRRKAGNKKGSAASRAERRAVLKELRRNPVVPQAPTRGPPTRRQMKKIARNTLRRNMRAVNKTVPPIKEGVPTVLAGVMTASEFRNDPRRAVSDNQEVAVSSQQKAIPISQVFEGLPIAAYSAAFVVRALERGYAAEAEFPYNPWLAWLFMIETLSQFISGGVPAVTQVPYFLLAMGRALSRKDAPFVQGKISYTGVVGVPGYEPNTNITLGYATYPFKFNVATVPVSPTLVDGFPLTSNVGYPGYTSALGATAFAELCTFMSNSAADLMGQLCKNVSIDTTKTSLDNNVSVFAQTSAAQGGGFCGSGQGGIQTKVELEVPIHTPLLALFNGNVNTSPLNLARNYNRMHRVAGDPIFLGSLMCSRLNEMDWGMKNAPILKPVDFNAFGDVLAQWVVSITNAYFQDQATTGMQLTSGQIAAVQCPLTLQEMLLLLRNVMMQAFKSSQCGVQGIFPFVPSSNTDNQFVAFTASSSTCFISPVGMQLPVPFIENIRALVARHVTMEGGRISQMWEPVLGMLAIDSLVASDYVASYVGPDSTVTPNVFTTGILYKMRRMDKGKLIETGLVETKINLVDGSNTAGLVAINDAQQLTNLAQLWNDWLRTSNLSSYSVAIDVLGTEKGITALGSLSMTRFYLAGTSLQKDVDLSQPIIVDVRTENPRYKKVYFNTLYAGRLAVADSSYGTILAPPYEQVQSIWILPYSEIEVTGTLESSMDLVRAQAIWSEPKLEPLTTGSDGISLAQMHSNYASHMTKAKLSEQDTWMTIFKQCEEGGRGGILSSIIEAVGGIFGGPASEIAKGIAGVIG